VPSASPPIGVVIVAHHSSATIEACLCSIVADQAVAAAMVIDNSSDPTTRTLVAEASRRDHRITYFDPRKNLGFAGGVNLATALLPEVDYLCLASPRLRLRTTASTLCELGQPHFAVWAGVVQDTRGIPVNVRAPVTPRRELARAFVGEQTYAVPAPSPAPVRAAWLSAELLCLRRSTFEALGGFDECLEHHFADVDFCDRAERLGGAWIVPQTAGTLADRSLPAPESVTRRSARAVSRVRYLRKVRGDRPATSAAAWLLAAGDAAARLIEPSVSWRDNWKVLTAESAELRHPDSGWVLRPPGGAMQTIGAPRTTTRPGTDQA
jgi:hypothetical protein